MYDSEKKLDMESEVKNSFNRVRRKPNGYYKKKKNVEGHDKLK